MAKFKVQVHVENDSTPRTIKIECDSPVEVMATVEELFKDKKVTVEMVQDRAEDTIDRFVAHCEGYN